MNQTHPKRIESLLFLSKVAEWHYAEKLIIALQEDLKWMYFATKKLRQINLGG